MHPSPRPPQRLSEGVTRADCEHVACPLEAMARDVVRTALRLADACGWMTIAEAERYAHVAHGTLRQAVRAGEIESFRRHGSSTTLVAASSIDAWIRATWGSGAATEGGDPR